MSPEEPDGRTGRQTDKTTDEQTWRS